MAKWMTLAALAAVAISGCTPARMNYAPSDQRGYAQRPVVSESLFKSDQKIVSNEAIRSILNGRIELPDDCNVAVVQLHNGYFVRRAGREAAYLDALVGDLKKSEKVAGVTQIPDLLLPVAASVPKLREAAARLQCELILVCRINNRMNYRNRFLRKDTAKVRSSAEGLLIHTRTGIVPFTAVIDEEHKNTEKRADATEWDFSERASTEATLCAMSTLGRSVKTFLDKGKPVEPRQQGGRCP